jgi:hypothetical protein
LIRNNAVAPQIANYLNHPALYSLTTFYGLNYGADGSGAITVPNVYAYPALFIVGYFLIILALMLLSMDKKRYISLLLVFLLLSSIIFSVGLYNTDRPHLALGMAVPEQVFRGSIRNVKEIVVPAAEETPSDC